MVFKLFSIQICHKMLLLWEKFTKNMAGRESIKQLWSYNYVNRTHTGRVNQNSISIRTFFKNHIVTKCNVSSIYKY